VPSMKRRTCGATLFALDVRFLPRLTAWMVHRRLPRYAGKLRLWRDGNSLTEAEQSGGSLCAGPQSAYGSRLIHCDCSVRGLRCVFSLHRSATVWYRRATVGEQRLMKYHAGAQK